MKKLLSLVLTLIMLASCFSILAVSVSAAEGDSIVVYDYEATNNGTWKSGGEATDPMDNNTTLISGKTVPTKTYTKPLHATWGYPEGKSAADFEQITLAYAFANSVDISNMKWIALEFYSPDKSLFDHRWRFALTSNGDWKGHSADTNGRPINGNVTDLGDGWYRVEIDIDATFATASKDGGLDKTKCNYFRMYYDGTETVGCGDVKGPFTFTGSYTFGVRNITFSKYKVLPTNEIISVYDYQAETNGTWKSGGEATDPMDNNTTLIAGKTVPTKTYTKPLHATWGYPEGKTAADFDQISIAYSFANAVDISNMKWIAFEFYSPDKSLFDHRWRFALTSNGDWKGHSADTNGRAINGNITDLGDGWYRVEIDIDATFATASKDGGLDKTKCNYFRMYYDATETVGNGPFTFTGSYTFGVRSIAFAKYKMSEANLPDDTPEKVAAIVALFAPIKDIKTGDVTAENYESVKAALAAAEEAYKAADEAIQERVRAECDVIIIMGAVKQAITAYEKPASDTPTDTNPADTAAADTTPASETSADTTEESKGCGSSIGISAVALVLVCALGVAVYTDKKRINIK